MGIRKSALAVVAVSIAVVASACSSSPSSEVAASSTTSTIVGQTSSSLAPPGSSSSVPSELQTAIDPGIRDLWRERTLPAVAIGPPDSSGGPHPVLSWLPVEGAETYWVMVHDMQDLPFWAWTGTDTEVRLGGGDVDELNQTAALYQPMTWRVVAIDSDGGIVAFSEDIPLVP